MGILKNSNGYGLLLLMVSMAAIVLTAGYVTLNIEPDIEGDRVKQTMQKMDILREAILKYQADVGAVPGSLDDLISQCGGCNACSIDNTPGNIKLQDWCGPYVDQVFQENINDFKTDQWGTTIEYISGGITLRSWGPNKADNGGGGDDISISF